MRPLRDPATRCGLRPALVPGSTRRNLFTQLLGLDFLIFSTLTTADEIIIKKGPYYKKDGVHRYLPNIQITFKYTDTKGQDYNKIRTTDGMGNIVGGPLPLSPGAKVDGNIEASFDADYVKGVFIHPATEDEISDYFNNPFASLKSHHYKMINQQGANPDYYFFPEIDKGKDYLQAHAYYFLSKFLNQIDPRLSARIETNLFRLFARICG